MTTKEDYEHIAELVNHNKCTYYDNSWGGAIEYIMKDLKYRPNNDLISKFNTLAIKYVTKDLKVIHVDDNIESDKRDKAFQFLAEILTNEIDDPELKSLIDLQRRKMICEDYIINN